VDNFEDLNAPQGDVPENLSPDMHSDMSEDADDDDYLPTEGVQSTLMPHDLHEIPILSPDLQDVSRALEGEEGLEVVDNPGAS
jgi:hypothetical protein